MPDGGDVVKRYDHNFSFFDGIVLGLFVGATVMWIALALVGVNG